ncbi:MAG TPA: non-heme iron oxygenase ferredoxin subunit, partial [Chloroflexia bacterium]|nr:non-heme iron oxygenase ferredoxin subunit [Chloroflexia bacterium]
RVAKDLLNGVWLGHPLHPVITDVPIGAWTTAEVLDVVSAGRGGDPGLDAASDLALGLGVVAAVGAAMTGFTDWSEVGGVQRRLGLVHGLINALGLGLNLASLALRLNGGHRATARTLSAAGYVVAAAAAYVGGDLVYKVGQSVNRDAWVDGPEEWTDLAASADLADGQMHKYDLAGTAVVLLRHADGIHAFAGTCPHFGGPLWEGKLDDHCVTCPWHGSQFDIRDGALLHGPSTYPIPCYAVQEQDGRVQVRLEPG